MVKEQSKSLSNDYDIEISSLIYDIGDGRHIWTFFRGAGGGCGYGYANLNGDGSGDGVIYGSVYGNGWGNGFEYGNGYEVLGEGSYNDNLIIKDYE